MKSALIFLALVALSQAGVIIPHQDLAGRIVDGEDVKLGEIPWIVSLQTRKDNSHFCGGSVLNKDYVITAAHCLEKKDASKIQIIAGSVNLNDPKSVHLAVKIITHEKYNLNWLNDIALIKVNVPFVESETLKFVPLPVKGLVIPAPTPAVVSGFGIDPAESYDRKILQRAYVLTRANEYCDRVYGDVDFVIQPSHICASNPAIWTGACILDGGGPLMAGGRMIGIASFTWTCGNPELPTVFTRVSDFIDWINQHAV